MVKATRQTKIDYLGLQIKVRDKLIGSLLHTIAENKISLQPDIITVIETLFKDKLKEKENEPERTEPN